eukprot:CAMPEP_0168848096 /NCGR_PEP_ID=MMETSP0727-20121128/10664_1 /TAXON_ID=265536 /ORGANISM="Amphiprora sp., Strain CCMP467" /LENGTH=172 /DNA_ID=CAMNT_0008901935 /DNA_START=82 /DNA_END=596 /DNA_ORIENTATION=+
MATPQGCVLVVIIIIINNHHVVCVFFVSSIGDSSSNPPSYNDNNDMDDDHQSSSSSSPTIALSQWSVDHYRSVGERLIGQAAADCCGVSVEQLLDDDQNEPRIDIDWGTPGKIVVTVYNNHNYNNDNEDDIRSDPWDDELLQMGNHDMDDDDDDDDDGSFSLDDGQDDLLAL